MFYSSYLNFLHQTVDQKKTHIVVEDRLVWIEKKPKGTGWKLCTEISSGEQKNWFLRDILPWQKGSYLERSKETGSLFLVQEIPTIQSFLFFKKIMEDFLETASHWKNIAV